MKSLNRIENGKSCTVTWMVNDVAAQIKEFIGLTENTIVQMKLNHGKAGVIIAFDGRRYAMCETAAKAVMVE